MRVREDRLGAIVDGRWTEAALRRHNPAVVAALDDLAAATPDGEVAARAGRRLAAALGLDEPSAPRVEVMVAARALAQVLDESVDGPIAVRDDPLLQLVIDGLLADASPPVAGSERRRQVARALRFVLEATAAQEEIDEVRRLVSTR